MAPPTTDIYTLSLHDALPICNNLHPSTLEAVIRRVDEVAEYRVEVDRSSALAVLRDRPQRGTDRKSTRLNSSHRTISYAVFCLKKKKMHQVSCDTRYDKHMHR